MTRKPHVVMFGGRFTFVQDWAQAALSAGVKVTLVEERRRQAPADSSVSSDSEVALRGYPRRPKFRPSRVLWPLNDRISERGIRQLVSSLGERTHPVTHLHTHFYPGSHVVARAAADLGIPLIHTEHSSALVSGKVSRRGRVVLLETCERAKAVLAVSEPLAQAMSDLGVTRPIEVVPNPVDLDLFGSPRPTAEYPPADGSWRFVTIGWLTPNKNHAEIIKAFATVKLELLRSSLTIIGDGELCSELQALCRSLGVAESVEFLGRLARSAVAKALDESHCYVHASRSETFGVALVEAWAAGLPVVTFPCGGVSGLADIIGGGLVAARDDRALAQAMVEQTKILSLDHRLEVRQRAWDHFSPTAVATALSDVYGVTAG